MNSDDESKQYPRCPCGSEPHRVLMIAGWSLCCTSGCGNETAFFPLLLEAEAAWQALVASPRRREPLKAAAIRARPKRS